MNRLIRLYKTSPAVRIATIYILVSCLYIFLSDYLVSSLFTEISTIRLLSIFKGCVYVAISGLFIYYIIILKKSEPTSSEERYRLLAELSFEGIVLHDNGIAIDANQAFFNITGYERDEIIGNNIIEILVDERYKQISYQNAISYQTGSFEIIAKKKNGDLLWVEIIGKPVLYQGKKVRVIAFRDITARKQTEQALVESERQLSVIFDSAPLLMMLVDVNSRVIRANQVCLNLSEKNSQQVIGLYPGEVINCKNSLEENKKCGLTPFCQKCVLYTSIKHTLTTRENLFKFEAKLLMGGEDNIFERNTLISTLYIEVEGNPAVLLSIDDITERVQMENILREKNAILLKAQEIAKVGEFYFDVAKRSFKLSDSLTKIAGLTKNIITIDEMYDSIHPDDRDETRQLLKNALEHLNQYTSLYRRYKPNGELQYLLTYAEIERDESGKAKRVFGVSRDITEQKKIEIDLQMMNYELQTAEEELRSTNEELTSTNEALKDNLVELEEAIAKAEESDRLKTAFLANMSHEVRTPMNAIMGFADILDMEDMPFEKRKKFTKTIRQRTKDLLNIINDILDISRIESHTLKIVEGKGNVNDVLSEIGTFFLMRDEKLSSKSISFEIKNELKDGQNDILCDFERLKQLLINIIDNAYKYTHKGEIVVGCKLADENNILFYVKDTGIGISKEKLGMVFERFRQADESYLAREYGGTGLGLSICKGILDLIGGRIWVESELEKGSTFFFTIPYKHIEKPKAQKEETLIKRYDFKGKTILIVEDVEYNMDLLTEILLPTNVVLLKAANGVKAMNVFHSNPKIDLVLMDIRLPDTNGFDLTKKMLAERSNLKVIAQTAYASEDDKERCFQAGCIDFVTKPISPVMLFDSIGKHIL